MKRRHFLQFAASTLGTIALSQWDIMRQGDRMARVLAQPGNRKLALLVGINDYSTASINSLGGCLNDVEMQKHLLVHRFGFAPDDVMMVWDNAETADRKPTRANILSAFENHLIAQAQPGDVVLFHYSGHGSLVRDPNPLTLESCDKGVCEQNGTLVMNEPIASETDREVAVSDIMGKTLFLLMSALKTDNVTVVLDSCHSGAGLRGNATVRAARDRAGLRSLVPSQAELDYQQQWLDKLEWSETEFQQRRQAGIAKGVAIGSARRSQLALDAQFSGFQAGAFTYFLTRYLWQQPSTETTDRIYTNLIRSTRSYAAAQNHISGQEPIFEFAPQNHPQTQPLYFCQIATPSAEAVITNARNPEQIEFWIGGVSSQNIENAKAGLLFNVLDNSGKVVGEIEYLDRYELYGIGKLINGKIDEIQPGQLLRERIVGIPANPVLKIGLDRSLGTDADVAQTELGGKSRVEVVPANAPMDYLLGRLTAEVAQQLGEDRDLPLADSIGLFSSDLVPIDGTFGRSGEPVISAINRLTPRFRSLLAHQILEPLKTGSSSPLQVSAEILTKDNSIAPFAIASRGAIESTNSERSLNSTFPQYPTGTTLQIQVENQEPFQSLYLSVLTIGANGDIDILYPANWNEPEAASLIETGDSLTVPRPEDSIELTIQGSSGFPEILILTSAEPLRNALQGLQTIARDRRVDRGFLRLRDDESVDIFGLLLGDVNQISRSRMGDGAIEIVPADAIAYDISAMAVLSTVIEVVG